MKNDAASVELEKPALKSTVHLICAYPWKSALMFQFTAASAFLQNTNHDLRVGWLQVKL
jgi:hypothetical protein